MLKESRYLEIKPVYLHLNAPLIVLASLNDILWLFSIGFIRFFGTALGIRNQSEVPSIKKKPQNVNKKERKKKRKKERQ